VNNPTLKGAKFESPNRLILLLVLNFDIPHRGAKASVTGELFYHKGAHTLLMKSGAKGVPQKMGAPLALIYACQTQVFPHRIVDIGALQILPFSPHKETPILSFWPGT
jgi:hypothetical protein